MGWNSTICPPTFVNRFAVVPSMPGGRAADMTRGRLIDGPKRGVNPTARHTAWLLGRRRSSAQQPTEGARSARHPTLLSIMASVDGQASREDDHQCAWS